MPTASERANLFEIEGFLPGRPCFVTQSHSTEPKRTKMLVPNRSIPKLAVASLVLGGCGSAREEAIASRLCNAFLDCDPVDFYYYYTSVRDCRIEVSSDLDYEADYLAALYSARCADAYLDLWACYSRSYDLTCDYSYALCSEEYQRYAALCS